MLRLHSSDLLLYAARVIPGNDKGVRRHAAPCTVSLGSITQAGRHPNVAWKLT